MGAGIALVLAWFWPGAGRYEGGFYWWAYGEGPSYRVAPGADWLVVCPEVARRRAIRKHAWSGKRLVHGFRIAWRRAACRWLSSSYWPGAARTLYLLEFGVKNEFWRRVAAAWR